MKKLFLSFLVFLASASAVAQDYKYLTVATTGAEQSIELATIQKITFDMQQKLVVVTTSEGQVTFPQGEMLKMFFADAPTAIERLPLKAEGLALSDDRLEACGKGLLRIYNAAGNLQRMAYVDGSASIGLGSLPAGIYIVNLGNRTIKISK